MIDDRRLRVLVVDDHDVVHWGFRVLLGEQPWVERFFQARTGAEALALTRAHKPHVALVDLFLAGESGAELCAAIREASPATRVLLISGAGRMSPAAARAAGASGFVSKDWEASRVAAAVRRVGLGMTTFPTKAEQPAPLLTEREREVLDLIAMGSTNREIAEQLYLSPAHGQGAHERAVSQAPRPQPGRGGAAGATDRVVGVAAAGHGRPAERRTRLRRRLASMPRRRGLPRDIRRMLRVSAAHHPDSGQPPHSPPLGTVNPYSPGYSAVNAAIAAGLSSVDLTGVGPALSVVRAHEALERRQLERVRDVAAGQHRGADR